MKSRACVGIGLAPFDRLIRERGIMVPDGRLEEEVGAGVDEEIIADALAQRRDPPCLTGDIVETIGPDDLILEIASDRPRGGEVLAVRGQSFRVLGVTFFEVDRHGQIDGLHDSVGIREREFQRHVLPVAIAVRHGDRGAAGGDRRGARFGNCLRAARVPRIDSTR
jgi:hypothetical protein